MKNTIYACAVILTSLTSPAYADPISDANYIVSQTVTRAIFEGALVAQRPIIIGAVQNDLRVKGITLPDPDRFFDLMMEEFMDEFTLTMQAQTADIFLENFSEPQLRDIASFFKTETGQAYLQASPTLMKEGARIGQIAGQRAGANAGKRLAERIEAEGLIVVDDPGLLSRLLDALR